MLSACCGYCQLAKNRAGIFHWSRNFPPGEIVSCWLRWKYCQQSRWSMWICWNLLFLIWGYISLLWVCVLFFKTISLCHMCDFSYGTEQKRSRKIVPVSYWFCGEKNQSSEISVRICPPTTLQSLLLECWNVPLQAEQTRRQGAAHQPAILRSVAG